MRLKLLWSNSEKVFSLVSLQDQPNHNFLSQPSAICWFTTIMINDKRIATVKNCDNITSLVYFHPYYIAGTTLPLHPTRTRKMGEILLGTSLRRKRKNERIESFVGALQRYFNHAFQRWSLVIVLPQSRSSLWWAGDERIGNGYEWWYNFCSRLELEQSQRINACTISVQVETSYLGEWVAKESS